MSLRDARKSPGESAISEGEEYFSPYVNLFTSAIANSRIRTVSQGPFALRSD